MGGLNDQIHVHTACRQAFEQAGSYPWLIRHMGKGQHGLIFEKFHAINRTTKFQPLAADRSGIATSERGAWCIAPAGANHHVYAVVAGDLNSTRVEHRCTQAGEFEHFIAAHLWHQLGIRHLAWIGGEHPWHIGEDLAGIRTQGCCKGNG